MLLDTLDLKLVAAAGNLFPFGPAVIADFTERTNAFFQSFRNLAKDCQSLDKYFDKLYKLYLMPFSKRTKSAQRTSLERLIFVMLQNQIPIKTIQGLVRDNFQTLNSSGLEYVLSLEGLNDFISITKELTFEIYFHCLCKICEGDRSELQGNLAGLIATMLQDDIEFHVLESCALLFPDVGATVAKDLVVEKQFLNGLNNIIRKYPAFDSEKDFCFPSIW